MHAQGPCAKPNLGEAQLGLVTKTWLPDALLRGCPSPRARLSEPARAERARSRLPDALLWPLRFVENLSFRSAAVATHSASASGQPLL
eukprot:COSAG06_NODE_2005_length_7867_cov_6.370895_9_plen_88_part_00